MNPTDSAAFFLLGLYALLITTNERPDQAAMLQDYLTRTLRSLACDLTAARVPSGGSVERCG